jgi:hypothetical protein
MKQIKSQKQDQIIIKRKEMVEIREIYNFKNSSHWIELNEVN